MRCTVESDDSGIPSHRRGIPDSMSRLICDMWAGKVQVTTWRRFNDPRLNELWDEGRKSNPEMSVDELKKIVQQEEGQVEELAASGTAKKEDFEKKGDWHLWNATKKAQNEQAKVEAAQHKFQQLATSVAAERESSRVRFKVHTLKPTPTTTSETRPPNQHRSQMLKLWQGKQSSTKRMPALGRADVPVVVDGVSGSIHGRTRKKMKKKRTRRMRMFKMERRQRRQIRRPRKARQPHSGNSAR